MDQPWMWLMNATLLGLGGALLLVLSWEIAWIMLLAIPVLVAAGLMAQVGVIAWGVRLGILATRKF